MKRNNNHIAVTAITICLAAVVAVVMGYSQWRESNRHDAQQPPTTPAFSESAGENKLQIGSDPEKGLWIHGTASKIDPSKSPTDAREIAKNTLLRYENNSSPIRRSEIVRHLSQLIGINITVGKTINIHGEPNVAEGIVPYFRNEVLDAAKDEDALVAVFESAIIKHPNGFLPLSQAYDIMSNKEQSENAEQFLIKVASFTKSELVWTKNGVEFQPKIQDVRPLFPKDHKCELCSPK